MPRVTNLEGSESSVPEPSVIIISSTWKKVFKNPSARNKGYRNIRCRRCRKVIPDYVWFYSKPSGHKHHKKTIYYCEPCYEALWV